MGVQLLPEVVGVAIIVLVYSFLCLGASCVMIWLVWTHHERDSYVALLSYCTLLGTVGSIVQQFHTFIWWRDVKTEQYEYTLKHLGSPEIAIAGASFGLDLVLFYIQYYTYNAEAMLTLFWAIALTYTVFKFAHFTTSKRVRHRANQLAKLVAIILPAILMALLRVQRVQNSQSAFLALANFNIMISLTIGSILLIAILIKYIYTRHRLVSWNARYLFSRRSRDSGGDINVLEQGNGRQSIYDRWLVLRFSIGFVVLATFQLITILSEVAQLKTHTREELGEYANLSASKARTDFLHFLAGVSTSLLVFVVFGTTRTFRQTMYKTFIPRRFRKQPADVEAPAAPIPDRDVLDETDDTHELQVTSNEGSPNTRLKNANEATPTTGTESNRQYSPSSSTQSNGGEV